MTKRRVSIGAVYVAVTIGFKPDAVTVYNPSDRRVYVREGAADSTVGPTSYDYVVQPGGGITVPTDSQNFSFVQEAGASRDALAMFWTRDLVSPSFSGVETGAGGGGTSHAVADGVITVTSAAVVQFAPLIPPGVSPTALTLGPVENADVRVRITGNDPTPTVGEPLYVNDVLVLDNESDIRGLRIIGQSGTAASMYWTLSA